MAIPSGHGSHKIRESHMAQAKIQLYSLATPNGKKVSIALEEMGLPYDAIRIDISAGDQFTDAFIAINPNSKIPAIVDPEGPDGRPLAIMESGAILVYLAEKSGKLLPSDPRLRCETLQWLFFQVGGVGPMFGQFGHFHLYAKDKTSDDYARERYTTETRRLLKVLDERLKDREFLMDDYSIVDIATLPWVICLRDFYKAADILEIDSFEHLQRWWKRVADRPAYQRGSKVCSLS